MIMNNSKTEAPICTFLLTNLDNTSQDTEKAFQTRLAFFKKLITEKGIH